MKRRKANWIGHILRRNCPLKHVTEGKIEGRIEVTGRGGRRCKQLLDEFRIGEDAANCGRKHWSHSAENLLLKRLWNCRQTTVWWWWWRRRRRRRYTYMPSPDSNFLFKIRKLTFLHSSDINFFPRYLNWHSYDLITIVVRLFIWQFSVQM